MNARSTPAEMGQLGRGGGGLAVEEGEGGRRPFQKMALGSPHAQLYPGRNLSTFHTLRGKVCV